MRYTTWKDGKTLRQIALDEMTGEFSCNDLAEAAGCAVPVARDCIKRMVDRGEAVITHRGNRGRYPLDPNRYVIA